MKRPAPSTAESSRLDIGGRARHLTALLCALVLLLLAADGAVAEESMEMVEERTVYTKTFENTDGSLTMILGSEPLHYQATEGEPMEEIDATLDAGEESWINTQNSFPVELPRFLGSGEAVRLGADFGAQWVPGPLMARLQSGGEVLLADPQPAVGETSEDIANGVLYSGLYPGIDVTLAVRGGELRVFLELVDWTFELAPEQLFDAYIDLAMDIAPELLESAQDRLQEGVTAEQIPLSLGRSGDEYVIAVVANPGISAPQLEEHAEALSANEEGRPGEAPAHWRSSFFDWLEDGVLRVYLPGSFFDPVLSGWQGSSSSSAALTASFKFTRRTWVEKTFYFAGLDSISRTNWALWDAQSMSRTETPSGPKYQRVWKGFDTGKGDGVVHRSMNLFYGLHDVRQKTQNIPGAHLGGLSVVLPQSFGLPSGGVVALDYEGLALYAPPWSSTFQIGKYAAPFESKDWAVMLDRPYNEAALAVNGGSITVGTWHTGAGAGWSLHLGNLQGPLSNLDAGATTPRAVVDALRLIQNQHPFFAAIGALPQDSTSCTLCTSNHPDPAVQALNGDYRVGASFGDAPGLAIHLLTTSTGPEATVTANSVGGHNDQLYPGESLEWELELTAKNGGGDLELHQRSWPASDGVVFSFRDAANPSTVLQSPKLSNVGDKVRVRATWQWDQPKLYGKTQDLLVDGYFTQGQGMQVGEVKIPIILKAPEGQPTFSTINQQLPDDISSPMSLAGIQLPAQTRAVAWGQARLNHQSGSTSSLQYGVHWDASTATPGNDGTVYIYPDQFKPGMYTVDLIPCVLPDTLGAQLHCGNAQSLNFEIYANSSSGSPQPSIDFVAPWSVDDPSGGTVTVSVFGADLGGGSGTSVTIPQVVAGASPAAGSSATQVNLPVTLTGGTVCGPRQLSLTTSGGTATATFNVTKPFAGSPNHWVTEAEGAQLNGLTTQSMTGASGGEVVAIAASGAPGNLKLRFQVPATSSSYQLYTVYGTPELNASRADLTIRESGNVVSYFKIALPMVAAGQRSLRVLHDATQSAPPTLLTLEAGKTYELEIASRAGQRYPLFDLFVLSDGSMPPTLAELCL
ncbi:MAG: hypothetical protein SX243_14560 [Acidobacteriota bacterium]|nr:hypothetical protein [Acidobacteriota bacterium]